MADEGYSPMTNYLDSLKKKIAGLEAELKEKDFHLEQEVLYKMEERKIFYKKATHTICNDSGNCINEIINILG